VGVPSRLTRLVQILVRRRELEGRPLGSTFPFGVGHSRGRTSGDLAQILNGATSEPTPREQRNREGPTLNAETQGASTVTTRPGQVNARSGRGSTKIHNHRRRRATRLDGPHNGVSCSHKQQTRKQMRSLPCTLPPSGVLSLPTRLFSEDHPVKQLIAYLLDHAILDFSGDLDLEMVRQFLHGDDASESRALLNKLSKDGGVSDMMVTLADCLLEQVRKNLSEDIVHEQIKLYVES
jgi:hypothetical protein